MAGRKIVVLAGALLIATTGGVTLRLVGRGNTPTPEAVKLFGIVENLAALPDLTTPEKVEAALGLSLRSTSESRRATRCPGHPVQVSQGWQSRSQPGWFIANDDSRPHPAFTLELEDPPSVCPSDPVSSPATARFVHVEKWHCINLSDLGSIAARFKTTYQGHNTRILRRDVVRPDRSTAQLEVNFGSDGCLFSVSLLMRRA